MDGVSRKLLEEEGLSTSKESVEIFLPVIKNLGKQKLKTIRLKKTIGGISTEFGDAFRKLGPIPTLKKPSDDEEGSDRYFLSNQVVLNWYPKIQALRSRKTDPDSQVAPHQAHLSEKHLAFIDWDALYFDLERFKAERGWYNLNLTREGIMEVLSDTSWYQLLIPAEELAFDSFGKVRIWQEIAGTLLKKYTERYYTFRKRAWEMPHLEYRELDERDPNFLGTRDAPDEGYYRIIVDKSQDEIIQSLLQLKAIIEKGDIQSWEFQGLQALWFSQHLYQPLLYANNNLVEISPVALNEGEKRFVEDLRSFYKQRAEVFKTKQLFLLRNLSRGRGVGFFEAASFHPDFILWLLDGKRQHIVFVDPKGLRNLGITDPKIQFYKTIKETEKRLGDPSVSLDSFLVSRTSFAQMKLLWSTEGDSMTKENLEQRHILFQDDQDYIEKLFRRLGFFP